MSDKRWKDYTVTDIVGNMPKIRKPAEGVEDPDGESEAGYMDEGKPGKDRTSELYKKEYCRGL